MDNKILDEKSIKQCVMDILEQECNFSTYSGRDKIAQVASKLVTSFFKTVDIPGTNLRYSDQYGNCPSAIVYQKLFVDDNFLENNDVYEYAINTTVSLEDLKGSKDPGLLLESAIVHLIYKFQEYKDICFNGVQFMVCDDPDLLNIGFIALVFIWAD